MKGDPAEIRKRIHALRKSQDPKLARPNSAKICAVLTAALPRSKGLRVGLYRPLAEEVDLADLAKALETWGARLHYPRIIDANARQMEFLEAPPGSTWIKGAYGIEEPANALPPVRSNALDLIVVPGVAFSPTGERIGRGAGYYDRALKMFPDALKVALAFDFQILPSLPQHSEDQKVDWVLTECQDLRTPKVTAWLKQQALPANRP